jgi:large subunit ribosomal protein L28
MAKVCEICGKGPKTGSSITRKGLQKKKGGIGLHITGVTKRRFLPNIQRVRVSEGGRTTHRRVCASCIKSGKIVKA